MPLRFPLAARILFMRKEVANIIRFIPREKLSRKARRELDQAKRQTWGPVSPVTRRMESKKRYKRRKPSRWTDPDSMGAFLIPLFDSDSPTR